MGVCSVIMIFCTVLRNISSKPFQSKFQGQGVSILKTNQGIRAAIDKSGVFLVTLINKIEFWERNRPHDNKQNEKLLFTFYL